MWIWVSGPLGVNSKILCALCSLCLRGKGDQNQLKHNTCEHKSVFWRTASELRLSIVSIASNESRHSCTRTGLDVHQKLTRCSRSAANLTLKDTPLYQQRFPKTAQSLYHTFGSLASGWSLSHLHCTVATTFAVELWFIFQSRFDTGCQSPSSDQGLEFFKPAVFAFRSWRRALQQSAWEC